MWVARHQTGRLVDTGKLCQPLGRLVIQAAVGTGVVGEFMVSEAHEVGALGDFCCDFQVHMWQKFLECLLHARYCLGIETMQKNLKKLKRFLLVWLFHSIVRGKG